MNIPKRQLGAPRFGSSDVKANSEVVTYQLSPEELEQYRKGGTIKMVKREEYLACKEKGMTDKESLSHLGIDNNRLYNLKKQWGLIGERGKPVIKKEVSAASSSPEKKEEVKKELKELMANFSNGSATILPPVGTTETIESKPSDEVKRLQNELEQAQAKVAVLQQENESLRQSAIATEFNKKMYAENAQLIGEIEKYKGSLTLANDAFQKLEIKYNSLVGALKVHL
ncbi:hypothetical protein A374_08874 [Fictibacillus macauensis ZFHKF-1]|uniref:Uncharacterized protein n=1 Tax=Fictibacillus macauensis ZFHKF-1 TaxID=1196324 RepID=I8J2G7_9BACL|nr:hypothetical protein [Fictibacillus macauensis]EIT85936.1 hypothetical protein A374_08874 [Fictibacillus macauensis ZFHKF-1]